MNMGKVEFILDPKDIKEKDFELVGREAIDIAFLVKEKIPIPASFVISTLAFDNFIVSNNLVTPIASYLKKVKPFLKQTAIEASKGITELILDGSITDDLYNEVELAYKRLSINNENPIVSILNSNIIEERFVPENNSVVQEMFLKGLEDLIDKIKVGWTNLFSADALEFRANGYYKGEISVGLIVQKLIRTEVSGISDSATISSKNEIKTRSVFGIENIKTLEECDIYITDKKSGKIKSKNLQEQNSMFIHEINSTSSNKISEIELSSAWKRNQKIDDESIVVISNLTKKIENLFKQDVSVKWGIEAGKLYVLALNPLNINNSIINLEKNKSKKVDIKPKADIDSLAKEILNSTQNNNNPFNKSEVVDLPNLYAKEIENNTKAIDYLKNINSNSSFYLDISNMQTKHLTALQYFAGSFFDGTQTILNNKILPEEHIDNKKEMLNLVEKYSLDISTAARCSIHKPTIYQLSTISKPELLELKIDTQKYKYNLDERFIDYPESLGIEVMAVKKSRILNNTKNLHVCISGVRNTSNLEDILKVFNASGLRRSANFKIYAEVCIPSFVFELDAIETNLIDGVVVNYSKLLKSLAFRSEIRKVDHQVGLRALELINQICKEKNLEFIVRVGSTNVELLKKLKDLKTQSIIFTQIPNLEDLKLLSD